MNVKLLLIALICMSVSLSCKQESSSKEPINVTEEVIKEAETTIDPTLQVFKGQFIFDENKLHKSKTPRTRGEVRESTLRKALLRDLSFTMTFYGDGNGIGLPDDGSHNFKYITSKELNAAKFIYEFRDNKELWIKGSKDQQLKKYADVIDYGMNYDYFEIQFPGLAYTIGMYKTGEYND